MIDRATALERARERAAQLGVRIDEARVAERTSGWTFPIAQGDREKPYPRAPFFVARTDGRLYEPPTARTAQWLDAFDRTGAPPAPPKGLTFLGDGPAPVVAPRPGTLREPGKP